MKYVLPLAIALWLVPVPFSTQWVPLTRRIQPSHDLSEVDRAAIQATIESQLDAFERGDGRAALAAAAPSIQAQFQRPADFLQAIALHYAPMFHSQSVEFLGAAILSGVPTQAVRLIGPDAQPVLALYAMSQQQDGSWKIAEYQLPQVEPGLIT